jgi:hypothetical protein
MKKNLRSRSVGPGRGASPGRVEALAVERTGG